MTEEVFMGIGSNLMVELAEQDYKEALHETVIHDAAVAVALEKTPREVAYKAARTLIEEESDVVASGQPEGLIEPAVPKGKRAQVQAIARDLHEQFEMDS